MSTPVQSLVTDAAQAIGDPNKQRVSLEQWNSIYNRCNRELCQKAKVLKFQDKFDLVADQRKYDYPEGMVSMTDIHVTETPADESTFRYVEEMFEDEFREWTSRFYPKATLPDWYYATSSWFHLVPMLDTGIIDGGCITYYGLPDTIDFNQFINGVIQVPDFAQDYLVRRMIIMGMEARNRLVEAKAALDIWNADMETLQDKLDDRSDDRRSSFAPRKNRFAGMR